MHRSSRLRLGQMGHLSLRWGRHLWLAFERVWIVLIALTPLDLTPALGQTVKALKVPVIESYSQTEFTIYRGDRIKLATKVKGPELKFKWVRASGVICVKAQCEFDTHEWGLGKHRIAFIVFNQFGSLFLTYRISVVTPPLGYIPGVISVPITDDLREVEQVTAQDVVVKALKGQGYAYHGSKVQVVGQEDRTLEWSETLRAQTMAQLRFGRKYIESHVIFDRGVVHLGESSPKRRAIVLSRGSLRSRQLDGNSPQWTILIADGSSKNGKKIAQGSWLQVDVDQKGDVGVVRHDTDGGESKDKNSANQTDEDSESLSDSSGVSVQVFSGQARVFVQTGGLGEGQAWLVPAGYEIEVTKPGQKSQDKEAPSSDESATNVPHSSFRGEVYPLRIRKLNRVLKETSPEYQFGAELDSSLEGWSLVAKKGRPSTLDEAQNRAVQSLKRGELFQALENLAPYWASDKDDPKLQALAGEAYSRLGWYDQVLKVFDGRRPKLGQLSPKAMINLGVIDLLERRWKSAYQTFLIAKEGVDQGLLGNSDPYALGLLEYYLGYAAFRNEEYTDAENAMQRVVENTALPIFLRDAASGLKRESTVQKMWDINLGIGIGHDSNVLRTNNIRLITYEGAKFSKNTTNSLITLAHATAWAFRNQDGQFGVRFNFRRTDYLEPTLKDVSPLDQEVGFMSMLRFGLEEITKEAWFEVGLDGFIGMRYVGEERAIDYLNSVLHLGSPRLLNLSLDIANRLSLDPLPARNDYYDPEIEELVEVSDRSHRAGVYSLGIEPYSTNNANVGFKASQKQATYRALEVKNYNFKDQIFELYGGLKLPRSMSTGLSLTQLERKFAVQDPRKEYLRRTLKLEFGIKNLLSLNHKLHASFERQDPLLLSNYFGRNNLEYLVFLEF